jgi:NurA-like 5'-3' nuclease
MKPSKLYQKKIIIGINNTTCLGLELDKNISWKNHVQKILPKLSSVCSLARRMYPCCKSKNLKMIYFAYFHAVMEYGIIFWGDSVESKRIFQKQKQTNKKIRIMTGSTSRISCRSLFQKLQMLTLTSQYILSLMRFLSSNVKIYKFNTSL